MSKALAAWHCKKCKRKFTAMAAMKYHQCKPLKFQRPDTPKRKKVA